MKHRIIQLSPGRWIALVPNPDYDPGDPARCSLWLRAGEATSEAEALALVSSSGDPPEATPRAS